METVTIDVDKYNAMVDRINWLSALEAAGVDNWSGIGFAYELYREENPSDE